MGLPENTLPAFERAIEEGADYIELDVHVAPGGELVVTHDAPRPRGAHPTLAEVLERCRGRIGVMVELKTPYRYRRHDSSRRTLALLDDDDVFVCFQPGARRRACARSGPSCGRCSTSASCRSARGGARLLGGRLRERARDARAGSPRAQRLGLATTVYTVNEPARMLELAALGVTGIFTDRPDLALAGRSRPARLSSRAPSAGTRATTCVPTGSVSTRAVGTSAISSTPRPITFTRVTGPRKVCEMTSPSSDVVAGARAVRAGTSSSVSGRIEHEHPLAAAEPSRRIDRQARAAVVDLAARAVDDRRLEPVHRPDELRHERGRGRAVHLGRRADLLDPAAVHHGDAIGDRERLLLVVRDVDRRDPELELDAADLLAQLHAHLRVERRERLVEQEHARLDRQRARERDALLHAARELVRVALAGVAEPDELEQLFDRACAGRPSRCLRIRSPYSTFCSAVMFGKRLYAWKTMPMSRRLGGTRVMSLPSTRIAPGVGAVEAGDEAERGRLAAAARAEQGEELALLEREVDPVERDDVAERPAQLAGARRAPSARSRRPGPAPPAPRADEQEREHRGPGDPEAHQRHAPRPGTPCVSLMYWM